MPSKITNPILPGFYPDPSICKKDDYFYIATSSFQWTPGIPIHRSKDLRNWEFVSHALTNPKLADLSRIGDSYGIWAPNITYAGGLFYVIYTIVSSSFNDLCIDTNYLITAENIEGPWSEPVYLNSTGFDPSIFHNDDGKKYIVNMLRDNTPGIDLFGGILVQEYDTEKKKVIGEQVNIFNGSGLMATEAPHIFKRHEWYYLLVAEGGTSYHHAVTITRSKNLFGPYEIHPENPILTAKEKNSRLQKTGHADFVKVNDKEWAMVYLTSRPIDTKCMLGRETAIQKILWHDDDWPRTETNGDPQDTVPDFGLPESPVEPENTNDNFDSKILNPAWLTPRFYIGDWADLTSRPGYMRIHALPANLFHTEPVSFLARRVRHHKFTAETLMEFAPKKYLQHAGLVCYYDCSHWYYLSKHITHDCETVLSIWLIDSNINKHERIAETSIKVIGDNDPPYNVQILEGRCRARRVSGPQRPIKLSVECDSRNLQFYWAYENENFKPIGPKLDALILSDDYVYEKKSGFTGAFVGIAASDKFDTGIYADFDYFNYNIMN